jgi:ubiquitin carboxyl-terminal hydrolase 5/13
MADIDSPIQPVGQSASGPEPSAEQIGALADMGFTAPQARKALRETVRNINRIIHLLFI